MLDKKDMHPEFHNCKRGLWLYIPICCRQVRTRVDSEGWALQAKCVAQAPAGHAGSGTGGGIGGGAHRGRRQATVVLKGASDKHAAGGGLGAPKDDRSTCQQRLANHLEQQALLGVHQCRLGVTDAKDCSIKLVNILHHQRERTR